MGEAIDDGDYLLELAHLPVNYSGLALPNTVATPNHEARTGVCSQLIRALKNETTFETASIPKPLQQQKQQYKHPKITCMNRYSSALQIRN